MKNLITTLISIVGAMLFSSTVYSDCNLSNVTQSYICLKKENQNLLKKIDIKKKKLILNTCNVKNYSNGEGSGFIYEGCVNKKINETLQGKDIKKENSDGLLVSSLPYSFNSHLKCSESKNSCNGINIISTSKMEEIYNFMNDEYNSNIIFPETNDGEIVIISILKNKNLNIKKIDNLGIISDILITNPLSKKVKIDTKYNLSFIENGKKIVKKI